MPLDFRKLAYNLFGRHFRGKRDKYEGIREKLVESRMETSTSRWLSTGIFNSLLVSLVSLLGLCLFLSVTGAEVVISMVAAALGAIFLIAYVLYRYTGPGERETEEKARPEVKLVRRDKGPRALLSSQLSQFLFFLTGFVIFFLAAPPWLLLAIRRGLVFFFELVASGIGIIAPYFVYGVFPPAAFFVSFSVFLMYPRFRAWQRKKRIEGLISSAVDLMGSVAGVGLTPYDSVKFLAEEESYDEASDEMSCIVRDVELLGEDLVTAFNNLAKTTASEKLKVFLEGATTTITSGGDLQNYFTSKSEEFSRDNARELDDYLDTLGLIAQIFIVLGVVLPTLLVIMIALMGMTGSMNIFFLYASILILPIVTSMAVAMADSSEPDFLKGG